MVRLRSTVQSCPAAPFPPRSHHLGAAAALVIAASVGAIPAAPALAAIATAATVAALPPQATRGRGARVPFVEYEAENGVTNGRIVGPDRTFTNLAAEASGRRAVLLDGPGGFVEFVLAAPANAVTLRYALPDSATGGGLDGEIALVADGARLGVLRLTSRFAWLYGPYPFTNRPADGEPHHVFDEARLRLSRTLPAGARGPASWSKRLASQRRSRSIWLISKRWAPPVARPARAISILDFGADPGGAEVLRGDHGGAGGGPQAGSARVDRFGRLPRREPSAGRQGHPGRGRTLVFVAHSARRGSVRGTRRGQRPGRGAARFRHLRRSRRPGDERPSPVSAGP